MVIPRAIIRDLHTGIEATQLMALVMLVLSVSPMLAPLAGSALIVSFGWRAVFVTVTIAAVLAFILMACSCRRRGRRWIASNSAFAICLTASANCSATGTSSA
jgi:MFS family permease